MLLVDVASAVRGTALLSVCTGWQTTYSIW